MMSAVCHECVLDKYLSDDLRARGKIVTCTECGATRRGVTVTELGARLEPLLRRHYRHGAEFRYFSSDEDERGAILQRGETLSEIVEFQLGTSYSFHDEIIGAILDSDEYWPQDGDSPYWDEDSSYELDTTSSSGDTFPNWHGALEDLRHLRRFFSPAVKGLFTRIFEHIDEKKCSAEGRLVPVAYMLPQGARLYRARTLSSQTVRSDVCKDPARHVGPPPPTSARAGRMNPEGVSVLYSSLDEETCIAEMRPALNGDVAVATFITMRPLRILDFTRLDRLVHDCSIFDPDYETKIGTHRFLARLHDLISQPILPDQSADYLITQAMAEYLAHVHETPFDGVLFGSAQRRGGANVVVFPRGQYGDDDMNGKFGAAFEAGSLRIVRIQSVSITHSEMDYRVDGNGSVWIFDPYEDHDS